MSPEFKTFSSFALLLSLECLIREQFAQKHRMEHTLQGEFKKRQNFCYEYFILQYFKRCPLQSSPLYWRYTVPNVCSIVGMLPGTHFL